MEQDRDGSPLRDEEDILKRDGAVDIITDDDDGGELPTRHRRFGLSLLIVTVSVLTVLLFLSGLVFFHMRTSGTYSEAIQNLFEARSDRKPGTGRGQPGAVEESAARRQHHGDFVFHIAGHNRDDRLLFCDVVLEFGGNEEKLPDDFRMRTTIYRVSKEALAERGTSDMPSRLMKRELEKRIMVAAGDDSLKAVYFTRFIVLQGTT